MTRTTPPERSFVDMTKDIERLPRDRRGYPVPRFVAWFDDDGNHCPTGTGTPNFRVADSHYKADCVRLDICWLCGRKLGSKKAFVLGPMCCINRINSEPPCHYDCARFAARNCPFLINPDMHRVPALIPEISVPAPGEMIQRNPGVVGIWLTSWFRPFMSERGQDGVLFELGPPKRLEFWCEGRPATRAEVGESVRTGLPLLANDYPGDEGRSHLRSQVKAFNKVLATAALAA